MTDTLSPEKINEAIDTDSLGFFGAPELRVMLVTLATALEEAEGRERARTDKVEKVGCRAAELTFDWLCGEFEDLPNKLAEDMSVKITESIIWALGEGSTIDDFADAEQQVADLTARAEKAEQQRDQQIALIMDACDLLAERTHGNAARSPGHNARLMLEEGLQRISSPSKSEANNGAA